MVLSHGFPDTGIVLDLKELIDGARKEDLPTLFAIDGSQAIGNIMVGDETLFRSAYYVFHSQGWLLGSPSLGILIRNDWLLRVAAGLRQEISGIRFCFHHFHGDDDVRDLAELIGNTIAEADRPAAEGGLKPPFNVLYDNRPEGKSIPLPHSEHMKQDV